MSYSSFIILHSNYPHKETQMEITNIPVQTGPLYQCFECGQPMLVNLRFNQIPMGGGYSPLDEFQEHIWYVKKDCKCQPQRVVRLGDCIAPLMPSGPRNTLTAIDIPAIIAGLAAIARTVRPEDRTCEPAAKIVYGLLAGHVSPEHAIDQIRAINNHT